MADNIRVAVCGAKGKMGSEVVKAILRDPELELVGAVDARAGGDVNAIVGGAPLGIPVESNLRETLLEKNPDVLVDFTTPSTVRDHVRTCIELGVRPVVGTTGIGQEDLTEWDQALRRQGIGGLVAPNFAIGAVLMMKFAEQAARYLPHVEIIEMHHDQKLDAPSGTALKTAEMIAAVRERMEQGHPREEEKIPGAKGANFAGMRIHSVRLPGFVASQEVIFGGLGQTLTIRHDSISRESFMPGVVLGIKRVMAIQGIVYGLENLLG
jgi:4-hydroxy-tetrahydrodipicolinate reductase